MKNLHADPLAWVRLAAARKSSDTILTCYAAAEGRVVASDRHRVHVVWDVALADGTYDAGTGLPSAGFGAYPTVTIPRVLGAATRVLEAGNGSIVRSLVEGAVAAGKALKRPGASITQIWVPDGLGRAAYDAAYVRDALAGFPEDQPVRLMVLEGKRSLRLETDDRVAVISRVEAASMFHPPFDLELYLA